MPTSEIDARADIFAVVNSGTLKAWESMPTVDEPGSFIVVDIDSTWTVDAWQIPVRIFTPIVPTVAEAMTAAITVTDEYESLLRLAGYLTQGSRDIFVDRNIIVSVLTVTVYREDF